MVFDFLAGKTKVVIAMAHIGALPGTPLYDASGGLAQLIDGVAADIEKLQAGGVDAILFGNENDRPYVFKAPAEGIAAMTAVIEAVKPQLKVPFGVNYLWDPLASVAIGAVTGARFVREIFTGLFASDMGLWQPDCAAAARLRHDLGRDDMKMLFNINAEFAHSLDARPIALRAKSAVFSSRADAILVSGPLTGMPAARSDLADVCAAVQDVPVLANTGVTIDNVADVLSLASGVVIGTHFKVDGNTWNPVDAARVRRFMAAVERLR
jgi:membrane complex biogenesis BtpA family protein